MFIRKNLEKGQGLGEYALIISLVAVVVVVILGVFGEELLQVYCKIVFTVDPAVEAPMCEKLSVQCSGLSGGTISGNITFEALVTDTAGEDDVARVEFELDGTSFRQENEGRWCFNGGDSSCKPFNTRTIPNGQHTFRAVAYDAEGNAGYCEVTVNVQN
ncbi:MAG: hypothetical protein K8I82_10330 [Anaerolineae bacterium]|nr:hypothetical protein [Anaerolineae bacterium]